MCSQITASASDKAFAAAASLDKQTLGRIQKTLNAALLNGETSDKFQRRLQRALAPFSTRQRAQSKRTN